MPQLRPLSFALGLLVAASGCASETGAFTREEARAMSGGAADSGRDLCEENGWYGDGEFCDEFCPHADPDCTAACATDFDCPPIFCEEADCPTTVCVAGACAVRGDCRARLSWLQKDAYLSQAGRTQPFWPPHTTMVLTVACGDETVREVVAGNHGTLPDAVDASGEPILDEVWSDEVEGSREELLALADAFEGCECGNTFLSLDALDAGLVEELVAELAAYMDAHLECPESVGGTAAVVDALASGAVETAVAGASQCAWASGASWEDGLDEALGAVGEATAETLADYHVCNNDARLQADLFERFRRGDRGACDPAAALCSGPSWYYDPAR